MDDQNFEVTSQITGERFAVQFRWLQTAISLRHSDTVDVKFLVNGEGKVVALPHAPLERGCRENGLRLTDPLCRRVAARHLEAALSTGEDAGQDLLTLTPARVAELLRSEAQAARRS